MDPNHLDLEAIQAALNDTRSITSQERVALLRRYVPDLILDTLRDGKIDPEERKLLELMAVPSTVIEALADGFLSDAEIKKIRDKMCDDMQIWREDQLRNAFAIFSRRKPQTK